MPDDLFDLLFLLYFAVVVGVGVGVFARGATGLAALLVIAFGGPLIELLWLAIGSAVRARQAA